MYNPVLHIPFVFAVASALIAPQAAAEAHYASASLDKIGKALSVGADSAMVESVIPKATYRGRALRFTADRQAGVITQTGYRLFHSDLLQAMGPDSVLPLFLERYLLESELPIPDARPLNKALAEDEITTDHGPISMLHKVVPDTSLSISISFPLGRRIRFEWTSASDPDSIAWAIEFPKDYTIISGLKPVEAEHRLLSELTMHHAPAFRLKRYADRPADVPADTLFVAELTTQRYLDAVRIPVFNADDPLESIANMLTGTDVTKARVALTLDVSTYYPSEPLDMQLRDFIDYLIGKGCRLYCGVSEIDDEKGSALLVATHPTLGYAHAIHFSIPLEALTGQQTTAKAKMFPFIPLSKIKSLFFDAQ